MCYQNRIHHFFHHTRIGDPYLGPVHKEVTKYEITDHSSSTEEDDAVEQLAIQICNMLVIVNPEQPGSPERTRELWAPNRMPTIPPATHLTQQEQSQLQMATQTIARTLTETTTQPDITQQLSQSPEESAGGAGGLGGSIPLRTAHLNDEET